MTNARQIKAFAPRIIDISAFRIDLKNKYPESTLLKVIEAEPDTMTFQEFLLKLPTWLKLSREVSK